MKDPDALYLHFATKSLPPDVSAIQFGEMRKAFLCGMLCLLHELKEIGDSSRPEQDDAAELGEFERVLIEKVVASSPARRN